MQGAERLLLFLFMKYKMICLDLDGTLLTSQKTISKRNREAVQKAHENGFSIVVATGRQYRKAKELTDTLDVPLTLITNNGTVFRDGDGHLIKNHPMKQEVVWDLIERGKTSPLKPVLHIDRFEDGYDMIIPNDLPDVLLQTYILDENWARIVDEITYAHTEDAVSLVYLGTRKEIEELAETLLHKNHNEMQVHVMYNLTHFEAMLEFLGPEGTKWHAVEEYATEQGIRKEEIIAIGDDSNDIQLMENVGFSFAPANSVEGVKNVADIVLDETNDEDAVTVMIERIFS